MLLSSFASDGSSKSGKLIGVGVLVVAAVGGLIYSVSSYSKGDAITAVTESGDGRATMRSLTCSKCGYEEKVTSAEYNERMKERSDPTQWLGCPKCGENAVKRTSTGTPFGSPVASEPIPDNPNPEGDPAEETPTEEAPAQPKIGTRSASPTPAP